jgi:Ca-activated chloride channel homolog
MPVRDTMRLCSKCSIVSVTILVLALCPGSVIGSQQTPAIPAQQSPTAVDRDPVRSPDPEGAPEPNSGTAPGAASSGSTAHGDISRDSRGGYVLRRDVEEVILNATVLDENNHLVNSLAKENFRVTEDGVLQAIASFQHQDVPVSMGLLVDNSGSMYKKRPAVNTAALDLVKASNTQDESFVVNFADEPYLDQDFTSEIPKLRDGLAHIESKGGTALYDTIVASADQMSKAAKRAKQVLIVITDGEDNASSLTLEQTIRRVQELQGPVVYSIGLLFGDEMTGRESHRAKRALQLLSDETGGAAFFPRSLKDVDAVAEEVAQDIRSQYTIGYRSTKPYSEGGYRRVQVEAKAPGFKKLNVRTRAGYYPQSSKQGQRASSGTN